MIRNHYWVQKRIRKNSLTFNGETLMTYTIAYPEFYSMLHRSCLRKVNEYYRQKAVEFQTHCESELFPMAIQQYKEDKKNNYPVRAFDAVMKYELSYLRSCIISLVFDRYEYTGGAHGNTVRDSQTWNLNTCEPIRLNELVCCLPDAKGFLLSQVAAQMEQEPDLYFDERNALSSETFQEDQFYCRPDGLVLYYQQYDIAPYSSGIREFFIPYQDCVHHPMMLCR